MITDTEAKDYVEKLLDKLERKPLDCEVTDWEIDFLESNAGRTSFSERQKQVIEGIAGKN